MSGSSTLAQERVSRRRPRTRRPRDPRREWRRNLRWVALGLMALALWALWPLWPPLILATWFALVALPLHDRVSSLVGGRSRAAALLTIALTVAAFVPVVVVAATLAPAAVELAGQLLASEDFDKVLSALVGEGQVQREVGSFEPKKLVDALQKGATLLFSNAGWVASGAVAVVIGFFVFFYGFYVALVHGRDAYRWLAARSPLSPTTTERLANAYGETGRGLIIGTGLTALIQGALATAGYFIVGLPHALALGFLTLLAALIPSVGTGLVWAPVAAALFLRGDVGAGTGILVVGAITSVSDNFIRPVLSRYGKLELPTFVLLVGMLSGVAVFGGAGLLYGPLILRVAKEALDLLRERRTHDDEDRQLIESRALELRAIE
jgi:predicted PurR-regulated permease PerM